MGLFSKKEIRNTDKNYRDYLPVGTIIKLKKDTDLYMIRRYLGNSCTAIRQNNPVLIYSSIYLDDKEKIYYHVDYEIAHYPDGDSGHLFYILDHDIQEVIYPGYDDAYRQDILADIDEWNKEG